MRAKRSLVVLIILISMMGYSQTKVVYLENEYLKAGFLPDVGGRMVFIAPLGVRNFLYSDADLWDEPETDRIDPKPGSPFKPYNGLITWLGPQSAWWTQQDILPAKKKNADVWPPDPYIIYSNYTIVEATKVRLVLESPPSPISGVKLTKIFELTGDSMVIEVIARNIRKKDVSWDLWSNARFDAYTKFRLAVESEKDIRIDIDENLEIDFMRHSYVGGFFSFIAEKPSKSKEQRVSKAFIYPKRGEIIVTKNDWELFINFEKVERNLIHPEQALVEVYNKISTGGKTDILELEHHSAYKTLRPGQEMSSKEVWSFKSVEKQ
ncbi:MAG: DUF4380 domain-containing protein [Prolixibacteraceae bacterium]